MDPAQMALFVALRRRGLLGKKREVTTTKIANIGRPQIKLNAPIKKEFSQEVLTPKVRRQERVNKVKKHASENRTPYILIGALALIMYGLSTISTHTTSIDMLIK